MIPTPDHQHLSGLRARYESQPWAIQEWALESLRTMVGGTSDLVDPLLAPRAASFGPGQVQQRSGYLLFETIGIVPVVGALLQRASSYEQQALGCGCYDVIVSGVQAAAADPNVSTILLDIYSPGGHACGMQEAANRIRQVAEQKETVAFVDTLGASAAYGLACAANSIVIGPSAEVGCVGTVLSFTDMSGLYGKLGMQRVVITGADSQYKGMGAQGTSLTPAQLAHLRQDVQDMSAMFKAWVSGRRGGIASSTMQGQTFRGPRAVEAGLADGVVNDFSEMLGTLLSL